MRESVQCTGHEFPGLQASKTLIHKRAASSSTDIPVPGTDVCKYLLSRKNLLQDTCGVPQVIIQAVSTRKLLWAVEFC